jgi:DNA-binding beta-propeller fold protein YncE
MSKREVNAMKNHRFLVLSILLLLSGFEPANSNAQEKQVLRLTQTIPMPNVKGRIDHMDADVKGKRLFVAGLENGSLEVVDLQAGKWMKSISGFQKPQGIAYVESLNKVFVAKAWTASISMPHTNESTFRAAGVLMLDTSFAISKGIRTTTKPSGKSRRDSERARRSGRRT